MNDQPIGLAVIGAGYWGPNLVRNALVTPGFNLKYLCDLDLGRARAVLGRYSTVGVASLDEILADPSVRAVAVATTAASHFDVAMAALEAGRHVLVEKPLAPSYRTGAKLVAAAAERGLILMLDHTYCYTPAVTYLRELVRGGELGDLQFVDSVRINLGLVQPDVDVLWDLAPHDLAILDSILPAGVRPVAVAAHGSDPIGAGRACVAYLAVRLSNGAMAHAHVNWLSPTKVRTTILGGSARTVVWDDLNPTQRIAVHDRGVDRTDPARPGVHAAGLSAAAREAALISYRIGDTVAPALTEREALRSVMQEFAECVATGRVPLTDGHAGLRVLAVLEAASESLATGGGFVPIEADSGDAATFWATGLTVGGEQAR